MSRVRVRLSVALVLAVLVLGSLATGTASSGPPPGDTAAERLKALEDLAESQVAEEDYFDADRTYRRLLFATGSKAYAKKLRSVDKKLAEQVIELVADLEPGSDRWLMLLNRAFEFDPRNAKLKKILKKGGCSYFNGAWRPEDRNKAMQTHDRELAEVRRMALGLPEMRVVRGGPFRFFTDVKAGNQQFENMVKASNGVFRAYWEEMRAFDLRFPEEGLDVVVLTHEKDYVSRTDSEGTAGVYIPSRGASYFFLSGSEVFQTLLHELIHKFNHKVGYFGNTAACIEEGMAEYYGWSKLSGGMSRVQPGAANPSAHRAIQDAVFGRKSDFSYLPFSSFLVREDPPNFDFYQQSWAFYTFLVRSPDPRMRLALHDYLVGTRDDGPDVPTSFRRFGFTPAKLEEAFREYWSRSRS